MFKIIFISLCFLLSSSCFAQLYRLEVVTGLSLSKISGERVEPRDLSQGLQVGVLYNTPISHVAILRIGILYNRTKFKIHEEKTNVQYITIPVHFKYELLNNHYIYFGTEASIFIDQIIKNYCDAHDCEKVYDFEGGINESSLSLTGGLEFSITDRLALGTSLSAGLSRILTPSKKWAQHRGYVYSTEMHLSFKF